ncbi:MAG TPA: rhomboid family intramembrane serine protease [Polyangiaceae bacterium]|jgi:membrane associated rhomboid family serine protease
MTILPPLFPLRDRLPTRSFPVVNYALIVANVAVFLLQLSGGVTEDYAFVPRRLFVDPVVGVETVFTAMFMHASLGHIAGNMLYLWIFGDNVEDAMGHVPYLLFYLVGGVCAAAAQTLVDPTTSVPMLGASGAISAVLGAYLFLYPRSPITVFNPVFLLWFFFGLFLSFPAWLVIGEFFVVNLWSALTTSAVGGVAFMAHVGGFVGGVVLHRVFLLGRPRLDEYDRHDRWANRRRGGRAERWN